uniref:Uncharacterized protein n=1 Tax=Arundo donax TaxID=35708 RepID=A0A0A9CXV7_ARUDO
MAANGAHIFSVPRSTLHPAPARLLPGGPAGNPTLLHVSTSLPRFSPRRLGCCARPARWLLRRGNQEVLLKHSSMVPNLGGLKWLVDRLGGGGIRWDHAGGHGDRATAEAVRERQGLGCQHNCVCHLPPVHGQQPNDGGRVGPLGCTHRPRGAALRAVFLHYLSLLFVLPCMVVFVMLIFWPFNFSSEERFFSKRIYLESCQAGSFYLD